VNDTSITGNGAHFHADKLIFCTNLKFAFLNLVTQNSDQPPSTYFGVS